MGEVEGGRRKQAMDLKRQAQAALAAVAGPSAAALAALKAAYRTIDEGQDKALWERVRELFDYPVFVAAPKTVGITSTGETGEGVPNELGAVLAAYREFETWARSGAEPEDTPNFLLPSAA